MSNIFCLRNLQESAFLPNYDNTILYKEVEQSFTSETFKFLMEMNDAFREENKIFYRTVMESGDEFEVINEGVSNFLDKIKDIINKFIKFLKSLFERFSILFHKMIGSDKYLIKNSDKLTAFDNVDNFEINGYNFTIDGSIPSAIALVSFNEDFLQINFNFKEDANGVAQAIQNQYDKFTAELENKYDKFRADVIGQDGYISAEDYGEELFSVYRDGQTTTSVIEVDSAKVSECYRRFKNYKEIEKEIKKIQTALEKDYKEIESKVKKLVTSVKDKDANSLNVSVDSDYATVDDFKLTNSEMTKLDMFIKAKADQIMQMSNIHSMAFSYKLDAVKDCYVQDKKILYKALNQIAKNHKGGK